MKTMLKDMLKGFLVIPYDDVEISNLFNICGVYISEGVNVLTVDRLVYSFVDNKPNIVFKEKIENLYAAQYHPIILPQIVTVILAQFVVYLIIKEEQEERQKAIYSSIVMNYMILRKGTYEKLLYPSIIPDLYGLMDSHIEEKDQLTVGKQTEIFKKIFVSDEFLISASFEEEEISEIKGIAKEAWFSRIQKQMQTSEIQQIENPFIKAYCIVDSLVLNMPWVFLQIDIVNLLSSFMSSDELKKKKVLSNIVINIKESNRYVFHTKNTDSSVLTRLLHFKTVLAQSEACKQLFTVKEFAIYLYYELMLDRIIIE